MKKISDFIQEYTVVVGDPNYEEAGVIKRVSQAACLCMFQAKTWISNTICRGIVLYSIVWVESWLFVLLILMELTPSLLKHSSRNQLWAKSLIRHLYASGRILVNHYTIYYCLKVTCCIGVCLFFVYYLQCPSYFHILVISSTSPSSWCPIIFCTTSCLLLSRRKYLNV